MQVRILCVALTVLLPGLFAECAQEAGVDADLSIRLASTKSLMEIAPHVKKVDVYLAPKAIDPRFPVNHFSDRPDIELTGQSQAEFIRLLNEPGNRRPAHDIAKQDPHTYACYIYFDTAYSTKPAYVWCTFFEDGRIYVNFYTGQDYLGRYNNKLGAFLEQKAQARIR